MDEVSPQLLDLIKEHHKDKEAFHMNNNNNNNNRSCEERKLELRLAPPGVEDWSLHHHSTQNVNPTDHSRFSLGYFSQQPHTPWPSSRPSPSLDMQNAEKKPFSPSQKRTAPGPVVGWPPIRSFRKNIANSNISSSKTSQETHQQQQQHHHHHHHGKRHVVENNNVGKFVKINMDGVPIGRKVDLNAYDTYQKLSSAVDQLFRCLLAAQRDSCAGGMQNKKEEEEEEKEKSITGLLDGSGEYTLVYEDNEGDRMLVGDVPWHMFVSTVKRLRVLKTCDLSALTLGSKQDKKSK